MAKTLLWWIPMVALAVALMDLPYGYYLLLRVVVCGACIYLANREAEIGRATWAWILAAVALLYNPLFRTHFSRELWSALNIGTVWLFAIHMWSIRRVPL